MAAVATTTTVIPASPVSPRYPTAVIGGRRYEARDSVKKDDTAIEHIASFHKSSLGVFHFLRLVNKIANLVGEIFKKISIPVNIACQQVATIASRGWTALSIPRMFPAYLDAKRSIIELGHKSQYPGHTARKAVEMVGKTTDFAAAVGYSAALFYAPAKNVADVLDLVHDGADTIVDGQDLIEACQTLQKAEDTGVPEEIKKPLRYTVNYKLMKEIKNVISVALGVLGLCLLAFGAPVIPALVLLTLGLATTVLSITAHYYKESRDKPLYDQFKDRHLELVATA